MGLALSIEGQRPLQPVLSAGFFVITKEAGCGRQKVKESTEEQQKDIKSSKKFIC